MSWIKDNKFVAVLIGSTLVGAGLLYFFGSSRGSTNYDEEKARFDAAKSEVSAYERLPLYPNTSNRDQKAKAIENYKSSIAALQADFKSFRPAEIKNISPQEFTNHLIAANTEIRTAFTEAGAKVPEPFFVGFENYKTKLAGANSTGVLDYQLSAMKQVLLALAKARPAELKNLHRPELVEEQAGQSYNAENQVARPYPLEITFTGPESSLREFLTRISSLENQFVVVRSIRILNTKKDPPKSSDAHFDKEATKSSAAAAVNFVLPGDDATPSAEAGAATAASAPTGRILSQVLGTEHIQVFVRLDILQFLPEKNL